MKKNEQNLWETGNTTNSTNIRAVGVLEKEREKRKEKKIYLEK